jgi:hypothetical protein
MAYVDDFLTISEGAAAVTTLVLNSTNLPEHVTGDVIVVGFNTSAIATSITLPGWTEVLTLTTDPSSLVSSSLFYIVATSSTMTGTLTFTSNYYQCHIFILKDVDTTTPLAGTAVVTAGTSVSVFNSTTMTTTSSDALILYYVAVDCTTTTPTAIHSSPGPIHFLDSSDNGGSQAVRLAAAGAGWYIQRTSGSTPTPEWKLSLAGTTVRWTVAFKNKTNGIVPPYIDDILPLGTVMMQGNRVSTTALNGESFPSTLTLTQLTGTPAVATLYDAPAAVLDAGINPYSSAVNSTPAIAATVPAGFQVIHNSIDMTSGWIVGSFMASTSKMANFTQASIKKGGTFLIVGSGTTTANNYRSFLVMARDNQDGNGTGFSLFSIQPNQTQTQYGVAGAAVPLITSMVRFGLFHKGQVAVGAFYYPEVQFIKQVVIAGGNTLRPVDAVGIFDVGRSSRLQLIKKTGAAELMAYVPIQIGGGDAVNIKLVAGALQFPRISNTNDREINYHGADNAIGLTLAGKSGDTIYMGDGYVITSTSPYYFNISASATSAASWYLTGLVIVKANVTLRNVMTFNEISFTDCPSLVFSGCTITNCKISGVPSTNDSLTVSATSSILNSTITVTGVSASNRWCSVSNPSIFNGCVFNGSTASGHAIRITTPGTYSLSNLTFNSFGTSSNAAIFNDSSGLVTLNISGGTIPTYRNGTSSTTSVIASVNITVTGLKDNTEIRVYTTATTTELAGIETATDGTTDNRSFTFALTTGVVIDIAIINVTYENERITAYTVPATNASIPIQQRFDRNYSNPV